MADRSPSPARSHTVEGDTASSDAGQGGPSDRDGHPGPSSHRTNRTAHTANGTQSGEVDGNQEGAEDGEDADDGTEHGTASGRGDGDTLEQVGEHVDADEGGTGSGSGKEGEDEDDDEEGGESEEDDDEEDEEPRLKVFTLEAAQRTLDQHQITAVAVSSKAIVLGTDKGVIVILDLQGRLVIAFKLHTELIKALSLDSYGEHFASASIDGYITVVPMPPASASASGPSHALEGYKPKPIKHNLRRPVLCVAIDPEYSRLRSRKVVGGGHNQRLVMFESWLTDSEKVIRDKRGTIFAVAWEGNLIAYALETHVEIYDESNRTHIGRIPRIAGSPPPLLHRCTLRFTTPSTLLIAWAKSIQVVNIKPSSSPQPSGGSNFLGMGHVPGINYVVPGMSTNSSNLALEMTTNLQTDCFISGIIPYRPPPLFRSPQGARIQSPSTVSSHSHRHSEHGSAGKEDDSFLVLGYYQDESPGLEQRRRPGLRPQLKIITAGEEVWSEEIEAKGFAGWSSDHYWLADVTSDLITSGVQPMNAQTTGSVVKSSATTTAANEKAPAAKSTETGGVGAIQQSAPLTSSTRSDGDDLYIFVSPRELRGVRTRDLVDHIGWLVENERFAEAWDVATNEGNWPWRARHGKRGDGEVRKKPKPVGLEKVDVKEIGRKLMDQLMKRGHPHDAARLAVDVLGTDAEAWEGWVLRAAAAGQLESVIPYVPKNDPRLSTAYSMILDHFLHTDPPAMLERIRTWSSDLYDIDAVIAATQQEVDPSSEPSVTMECLTELLLLNRQVSKALPFLIKLRKPGALNLVLEHKLYLDVQELAGDLVEYDLEVNKPRPPELRPGQKRWHGGAIQLLVDLPHSIPVTKVVAQLETRPKILYMYLDALVGKDVPLAAPYANRQVELYSEYAPAILMEFLRSNSNYDFKTAFEICQKKDMVIEMVFLLGRIGNNKAALNLIIERLGDVNLAIDFAKEQNDDELWEDLLKYTESKPAFIRGLLENVGGDIGHMGGDIGPLKIIRRIQTGLEIPGLKGALIKILQDFNLRLALMEGCKDVLDNDCDELSSELHAGQRDGLLGNAETRCRICRKPAYTALGGRIQSPDTRRTAIVFLCRHVFHLTCAFPDVADNDDSATEQDLDSLLLSRPNARGRMDTTSSMRAKIRSTAQLRSSMRTGVKCPACKAEEGLALV